MSKMPIAWHEECLKNLNCSVQRAEIEMQGAITKHARIAASRDHLVMQIEFAKKAGKDGFDNEKFMKVKNLNQPTLPELRTALQIAVAIDTECAWRDLARIRDRKHTWVGCEENALRVDIDRLLRRK